MNKLPLIALMTSTSFLAMAHTAQAVPNVAFISVASGSTFGTNLNTDTGSSGNNKLYAIIEGGSGNDAYIDQQNAFNTVSNTQQYGANNKTYVRFDAGATDSKIETYQGNSATQASANKQAVAVANSNYSSAIIGGSAHNVTTVQKGEQNVSMQTLGGGSNRLFTVQEMRDVANGDIVDPNGNHYKGGNDSVVSVDEGSNGNNVTVNQYQGNVSKVAILGSDNNSVSIKQVNTMFTANRVYNNVSVVEQSGQLLGFSISQTGAGNGSNVHQSGDSNTADATQGDGGAQLALEQSGSNNSFLSLQTADSTIDHTQTGSNNSAEINQLGGKNLFNVAAFSSREASGQSGSSQQLSVTQKGDRNSVTQRQTDTNEGGTQIFSQDGTDNTLFASQLLGGVATVTQAGKFNRAYMDSGADESTLTQQGERNFAWQESYYGPTHIIQTGSNHGAHISAQSDHDNTTGVTQRNSVGSTGSDALIAISSLNLAADVDMTNHVTIDQTGSQRGYLFLMYGGGSDVTLTQDGNGTANRTDVNVFGSHFDGDLKQSGIGNKSTINLGTSVGLVGNDGNPEDRRGLIDNSSVTLSQTGNTNIVKLNALSSNLISNITQDGNNNSFDAKLGHVDYLRDSNGAYILDSNFQATLDIAPSDSDMLWLDQAGTGNVATSVIEGNTQVAQIQQVGTTNTASATISGAGNSVAIAQNGTSNAAAVTASGTNYTGPGILALTTSVAIEQLGNSNTSSVTLDGTGDKVMIKQSRSDANHPLSSNAEATVLLTGNLNKVGVSQFGYSNRGSVDIQGNSNNVTLSQTADIASAANTAAIGISGDANTVIASAQGGNNQQIGILGNNNSVSSNLINSSNDVASQNFATVVIRGNDNRAILDQNGVGNYGRIDIYDGNSHNAEIHQTGNSNYASIMITSAAEQQNLVVTQTGNQSVSISR